MAESHRRSELRRYLIYLHKKRKDKNIVNNMQVDGKCLGVPVELWYSDSNNGNYDPDDEKEPWDGSLGGSPVLHWDGEKGSGQIDLEKIEYFNKENKDGRWNLELLAPGKQTLEESPELTKEYHFVFNNNETYHALMTIIGYFIRNRICKGCNSLYAQPDPETKKLLCQCKRSFNFARRRLQSIKLIDRLARATKRGFA